MGIFYNRKLPSSSRSNCKNFHLEKLQTEMAEEIVNNKGYIPTGRQHPILISQIKKPRIVICLQIQHL